MRAIICKEIFLTSLLLALIPVLAFAKTGIININTASVSELDTLPGIGPAYAQRIIDYRSINGDFKNTAEIQNVSGIGPSVFNEIKNLITVGSEANDLPEGGNDTEQSIEIKTSSGESNSSSVKTKKLPTLTLGKDRLESVGSPVEFAALMGGEIEGKRIRWNFGDGTESSGRVVSHVYEYPGEYIVVATADVYEGRVSSRVNVTIVDPSLVITLATPERIEIKNNSKQEANLYGRAIISGGKVYVFSRDTFIRAGQNISFSSKVTGLQPPNPSGVEIIVVGETEQNKIIEKVDSYKAEKIGSLKTQISTLQEQLALAPKYKAPQPSSISNPSKEEVKNTPETKTGNEEETSMNTASSRSGWLSVIKKFFLRDKK